MTTEQKEKVLNGKRYKIITNSLKGDESHDMIIHLNYSWHCTIQALKGN